MRKLKHKYIVEFRYHKEGDLYTIIKHRPYKSAKRLCSWLPKYVKDVNFEQLSIYKLHSHINNKLDLLPLLNKLRKEKDE